MRFAAVVKKFTFLFRGFPRRYAPLNDMMTTVLTAMTPECLLHAPFSKNKFFHFAVEQIPASPPTP